MIDEPKRKARTLSKNFKDTVYVLCSSEDYMTWPLRNTSRHITSSIQNIRTLSYTLSAAGKVRDSKKCLEARRTTPLESQVLNHLPEMIESPILLRLTLCIRSYTPASANPRHGDDEKESGRQADLPTNQGNPNAPSERANSVFFVN